MCRLFKTVAQGGMWHKCVADTSVCVCCPRPHSLAVWGSYNAQVHLSRRMEVRTRRRLPELPCL